MKHLLFIVLLLLSILSCAQVPGYMGKRFILSFTNYAIPAFEYPMARRYGIGLCYTNVLSAEYLVTSRRAIGISAQYVRTGFDYDNIYYNESDRYYKGDPEVPGIVNNLGIALSYKLYGKKRIAPLGNYLKMELLFTKYIVKYNSEEFYYRYYPNYYGNYKELKSDAGSGIIAFNGAGVAASVGRQKIFFDKLVLDYGVRASIMIPFVYDFDTEIENRIRSTVGFRFFSHQFLNLKLGIGFLAF